MNTSNLARAALFISTAIFISGCGGGGASPTSQTQPEIRTPTEPVQPWGAVKEFPYAFDVDVPKIARLPSGHYLSAVYPTGNGLYTTTFVTFSDPSKPTLSFEISQSELRNFDFGSDSRGNIHVVGRGGNAITLGREIVNSLVFNEQTGATKVTSIDKDVSASHMFSHELATSKSGSAMAVISYDTALFGNTDPNKGSVLFASLYSAQSGWSSPVQISEVAEYGVPIAFKVAASDNGKFAVIWEIQTKGTATRFNPTALVVRTYDPISGWSPQFTLHTDIGSNEGDGNYWLQTSVTNDGTVVAAWKLHRTYDTTQTPKDIGVYDPKTQSWEYNFIDFPGRRFFTLNSEGDGIILWEQTINGCQDGLLSIRFKADGTTTETENLTKDFNCLTSVYQTELFFESFEKAAVVWSEIMAGENSGSIGGTRLETTGNWSKSLRFAKDTYFYGVKSNIEGGRAGVSWRGDSSSDFSKKKFLDFSINP